MRLLSLTGHITCSLEGYKHIFKLKCSLTCNIPEEEISGVLVGSNYVISYSVELSNARVPEIELVEFARINITAGECSKNEQVTVILELLVTNITEVVSNG